MGKALSHLKYAKYEAEGINTSKKMIANTVKKKRGCTVFSLRLYWIIENNLALREGSMIQACIFDLDGTLADTLQSMAFVTNRILQDFGLPVLPVDNFRYYSGEGAHMLMRRCLKDAGDIDLIHLEEGEQRYRDIFAEDPMYQVVPYEGIKEVLQTLKKCGVKTAVCSNKPHPAAVKVIEIMFPGLIDIVMGQSSEIARKPAPDGVLKIAETFGIKPQECMYVGDTQTDMLTGKAAGAFTVGALWGFRDREELESSGADRVAEKPLDLLKIYEEMKP